MVFESVRIYLHVPTQEGLLLSMLIMKMVSGGIFQKYNLHIFLSQTERKEGQPPYLSGVRAIDFFDLDVRTSYATIVILLHFQLPKHSFLLMS